jgi:Tol biopolymer transport system component
MTPFIMESLSLDILNLLLSENCARYGGSHRYPRPLIEGARVVTILENKVRSFGLVTRGSPLCCWACPTPARLILHTLLESIADMKFKRHAAVPLLLMLCMVSTTVSVAESDPTLAAEVANKGWIVYSAKADNATWDLYLIRPDGTPARRMTKTLNYEEAAPRFSPDGRYVLYRRFPKGTVIDHDEWGFGGQVVIARTDGTDLRTLGKEGEYPWASWMPDGKHVSCLYRKGVRIVNVETGAVTREIPRKGIFQQLFPAPDGKNFCGTGNVGGKSWNIVCLDGNSHAAVPVHLVQSCTPDWFPDSNRVIYSSRPPDQQVNEGYGATQLWMANADGSNQQMIYGDDAYHLYGGGVSPDGAYVVFTKSLVDGGGSEKEGAPMFVMRLADAPAIGGDSTDLRMKHRDAKEAPLVELPAGWEPHWTYADVVVVR